MTLINRARMLWRQSSRFRTERDLPMGDDAIMLAHATEERLLAMEKRLTALEVKANGTGGRAYEGAANA